MYAISVSAHRSICIAANVGIADFGPRISKGVFLSLVSIDFLL